MAKKIKENTLDFFYLGEDKQNPKIAKQKEKRIQQDKKTAKAKAKKRKNVQSKQKSDGNEKFDFENEIVIGVTKIPENNEKNKTKI